MKRLKERIGMATAVPESPLSRWLSGTIQYVDQQEIHVDYTIRKEMTDENDNIHPGLLSVLQTEVAELMYFLITGIQIRVVTNIHNHFIRKSPLGSKVSVNAKALSGHFKQDIETTIRDESGQITAIGRITFSAA
ncbi:MAG: hypothetical protein HKN32_06465 [Flavobacteriales bacterium]|nr:hypothetical protein [Flavobacteriales bacterium]